MVSRRACSSIFIAWSFSARSPRASAISPMSSRHCEGGLPAGVAKVQLLRWSASRSSQTAGLSTVMVGIEIWWASRGSGRSTKISSRTVAKLASCAHSGLPTVISRAERRGQGTQVCQPVSPLALRQVRVRSPFTAKGRPMASVTRWFSHGLSRFQSKVRMITTSAAMSTSGVSTLQRTALRRRGMGSVS